MNPHLQAQGQVYKQSPHWLPPERALHPKENFPLCVSDDFTALSKWEFAPDHARTNHVSGDEKDQNECLKTQNITHGAAGRATVKTSGELHYFGPNLY